MTTDFQVDPAAPRPSFAPDKAFIAAFRSQYSTQLVKESERFAAAMVFRRGKRSARGDLAYARALVQSALSDTILGDVTWDYATKPLKQHVFDVLLYRIRNDRRHDEQFVHEPYEVHAPRGSIAAEVEAAWSAARPDTRPAEHEVRAAMVAALRTIADASKDDPDALVIIAAFNQGLSKRNEILAATGLTAERYHRAWGRLRRRAHELPNRLWSAVRHRG